MTDLTRGLAMIFLGSNTNTLTPNPACRCRCWPASFPRKSWSAHRCDRGDQRLEPHRDQLPRRSSGAPATRPEDRRDPGPGRLLDREPMLVVSSSDWMPIRGPGLVPFDSAGHCRPDRAASIFSLPKPPPPQKGAVDVHADHASYSPLLLSTKSDVGRYDTHGSAVSAQPDESQRPPATNSSSRLARDPYWVSTRVAGARRLSWKQASVK
jgi:hypothetical protein